MTPDTKIAGECRTWSEAMRRVHALSEQESLEDIGDLLDRAAARIEALEARTYAHMCRMDHVEIVFNDSEVEPCPLCVANATITRLRALVESAYRDAELLRSALQGIIDTDNHLHEGGEETRLFRADEQAARNALAGIGDYKGAHRDTCVKALAEFVGFHARGLAVPNRLWKQAADALGRLGRAT